MQLSEAHARMLYGLCGAGLAGLAVLLHQQVCMLKQPALWLEEQTVHTSTLLSL